MAKERTHIFIDRSLSISQILQKLSVLPRRARGRIKPGPVRRLVDSTQPRSLIGAALSALQAIMTSVNNAPLHSAQRRLCIHTRLTVWSETSSFSFHLNATIHSKTTNWQLNGISLQKLLKLWNLFAWTLFSDKTFWTQKTESVAQWHPGPEATHLLEPIHFLESITFLYL